MKNRFGARLLALLMAFALLFPACNKMEAATMNLMKAEGTVAVADDKGQDVPIVENLGLYSGYDMATQLSSYAWINLDQVKLAKMDEQSEIEIQKDGKRLEILLKSGSVFFNVTKPLEEDETLNICTSDLLVGIRGTCGWVSAEGGSSVHILEGTVAASLSDGTGEVPVTAGETGHLAPDGSVIVEKFTVLDVPDFVAAELEEDGALAKAVLDASGIDMAETSLLLEERDGGGNGEESGGVVDFSLYAGRYLCAATGTSIELADVWGSWTLSIPRPGDPAHLDTYSLGSGDGRLEVRDDGVLLLTLALTNSGLLVENTNLGGEFDHIVGEYVKS